MGRKSQFYVSIILLALVVSVSLPADTVHVLAKGETLYSLSRRYGVGLAELLKINRIRDSSDLSVGRTLTIPDGATNSSREEYVVHSGDTYYGIARKYHLDVNSLLSMNGRDASRMLRVGETLRVSNKGNIHRTKNSSPVIDKTTSVMVKNVPWWPVAGYMQPLDGKLEGVAIEAAPLSYVHAVAGGNVVWTGPYRGFGHVVLVDSNGYIYLYGGNEDLFVNVGQTVTAGSRIGRLGTSGPKGGKQDMIFSVFREGVSVSPDEAPRG